VGLGAVGWGGQWTHLSRFSLIAFCTRPPPTARDRPTAGIVLRGAGACWCWARRVASARPLHVSWLFLKAHWNRAPRRSAARGQGLHADSSRSLAFSLVEKLKSNVPTAFIPMDLENGDWHLATATQEPCDHKPSLNGTESIRMHLRGQKLIPQIFVAWYVCDCLQPNMI